MCTLQQGCQYDYTTEVRPKGLKRQNSRCVNKLGWNNRETCVADDGTSNTKI